jgi:hypothetical protein
MAGDYGLRRRCKLDSCGRPFFAGGGGAHRRVLYCSPECMDVANGPPVRYCKCGVLLAYWKHLCDDCRRAAVLNRNHYRRAAAADTDVTEADIARLKRRIRCPLCRRVMNDINRDPLQRTIDHIVPVNGRAGGTHTVGNLRCVCRSCNTRRPHDGSDFVGQLSLGAFAA